MVDYYNNLRKYLGSISPNGICNFADWVVENDGHFIDSWGDYDSSQYECVCTKKISFQYSIRNVLNNATIPSKENNKIAIGSKCIKQFLNKEEYNKILEVQNRVNVNKKIEYDKIKKRYKLCINCDRRTNRPNKEKLLIMCLDCDSIKLNISDIRRFGKLRMEYNCV